MACIHHTVTIERAADDVWAAVRDVGQAHRRLFPGVLTSASLDGDARTVHFANGMRLRERIVSLDDGLRRFAYAAVGGQADHHQASLQVLPAGGQRCQVVWITDVLPEALAPGIAALVHQGAQVMKQTLEAAPAP